MLPYLSSKNTWKSGYASYQHILRAQPIRKDAAHVAKFREKKIKGRRGSGKTKINTDFLAFDLLQGERSTREKNNWL